MSGPLVSVIIPSYNRPLFLKERSIPSVLRQRYPHWELLIIGDGPQDASLREAVDSFGDARIRYEERPRPDYYGLSEKELWHTAGAEARNHGLSLARGEVIAPLDDDDEFLPNHLGDAVEALSGSHCDLTYGCVVVRDLETGSDVLDYFPWEDETTRRIFERRNIMFHSSVCYHSRYAGLRYPTDGRRPADFGLWRAILEAGGRFRGLEQPQSIYYGDRCSGRLRLSVPSLPDTEVLQRRFAEILESRWLSNDGATCRAFEAAVADFVGVPEAVSTPSGDLALFAALCEVARRRGGDGRRRVIVPSYTHPSTGNAIVWAGLEPLFCDIDPDTLCLLPDAVAALLDDSVAAVLAVDAHGNPCDKEALERLAGDAGAMLVSDAAAAFGASIGGRRVGSFGDLEAFSFSGTKILTTGEGGIICCTDPALAASLRQTSRYGIRSNYRCDRPGINGKLAELPAALGLEGLPHVDGWLERRRRAADRYHRQLADLPAVRCQQPVSPRHASTWKDLALITEGPEVAQRVAGRLGAYRIDTRPYYRPLHAMPAFRFFPNGDLTVTERLDDAIICIPLYSDIRDEVVDLVMRALREALQ